MVWLIPDIMSQEEFNHVPDVNVSPAVKIGPTPLATERDHTTFGMHQPGSRVLKVGGGRLTHTEHS
jgi:hypothetical protein